MYESIQPSSSANMSSYPYQQIHHVPNQVQFAVPRRGLKGVASLPPPAKRKGDKSVKRAFISPHGHAKPMPIATTKHPSPHKHKARSRSA
mmetsp:Transcript_15401/g.21886  ORF Transcript_15401/g.21886 Transcript_15401/m.21886 type:complete len:90 (-) Transcript_15401:170-439(-)